MLTTPTAETAGERHASDGALREPLKPGAGDGTPARAFAPGDALDAWVALFGQVSGQAKR